MNSNLICGTYITELVRNQIKMENDRCLFGYKGNDLCLAYFLKTITTRL